MEWNKNSNLSVAFNRFYDDVPSDFNLSDDITIQAQEYVNKDITVDYQTPSVNFINARFSGTYGLFYGGDRVSLGVTPNYTVSKYLTLSGFYQFNHITFPDNPTYLAHVARLKVSSSFNVHLSINAFVQLNTLSEVSALNFRLRYNWKDGNDVYLVYNETLNNTGKEEPGIPFSDSRSLLVKYIHTFHLGK
jgi:hypothetical protein